MFVFHPGLWQCQGTGVVYVVDQGHGYTVNDGQALVTGGQQHPGTGRVARPAGVFFQFGDQAHQFVAGQQPHAHQQNGRGAVEEGCTHRRQRALHQTL
ncbi:hypothetical protein D3C71_1837690 [compost metagenome]